MAKGVTHSIGSQSTTRSKAMSQGFTESSCTLAPRNEIISTLNPRRRHQTRFNLGPRDPFDNVRVTKCSVEPSSEAEAAGPLRGTKALELSDLPSSPSSAPQRQNKLRSALKTYRRRRRLPNPPKWKHQRKQPNQHNNSPQPSKRDIHTRQNIEGAVVP